MTADPSPTTPTVPPSPLTVIVELPFTVTVVIVRSSPGDPIVAVVPGRTLSAKAGPSGVVRHETSTDPLLTVIVTPFGSVCGLLSGVTGVRIPRRQSVEGLCTARPLSGFD